ncbi:probable E3 SUMO-protein ligase RNF212 [Ambystoma mexicanum]|uniref:probable E3 SUMO-protein ligase RNF212 n=1 Tax=Ambystoma mexicanum TaxID=8296 RepID=UPI0037E8D362
MNGKIRCNVCFVQPGNHDIAKYALANCGHVLCESCLRKGKKEECTVCRAHCRIVWLSGQVNPDVQAFFMDVNLLCKKYSKQFAQDTTFLIPTGSSKTSQYLVTHRMAKRRIPMQTWWGEVIHIDGPRRGGINEPSGTITPLLHDTPHLEFGVWSRMTLELAYRKGVDRACMLDVNQNRKGSGQQEESLCLCKESMVQMEITP